MDLIDIHAHLETKKFDKDREEVIKRAEEAGVKVIINSGVNPPTNRKSLEFSNQYNIMKASFGLYPIDALAKEVESGEGDFLRDLKSFDVDGELNWIEENKDKCVAIGEVGLDYNWPDFAKHKGKQIEVFEKTIVLAKKIDKPLVVHSRKAELDAVEILEKHGVKKVVIHCFNGRKSLIRRGVENGWFFSVPPIVARIEQFRMLVDLVPLKQLLTETDSPYLSPVAGKRNEPANVMVTIEEIAKIKGIDKGEVAEQIFNNAKTLFGL
jgi:TatD DNase family protein